MVPGFWVGTIVTAPAACTSIHQPSCTQQVCKPCPERERAACQDATGSGVTAQAGRQEVVGLPALAALKPRILQVSGLNRVSSYEQVKRAQGPCDGL